MPACGFCKRSVREDETLRVVQVCHDDTAGRQALTQLGHAVGDEPTISAQVCDGCRDKFVAVATIATAVAVASQEG